MTSTYRTSLILDPESRAAARQIAAQLECSLSEAIRQAILRYRDALQGVPEAERQRRTQALHRLIELSRGNDPAAEVRRLKAEDEGS